MLTTPYFDKLVLIAKRTSTSRDQNNKLSESLRKSGFSTIEINQITETENFIRFRPSPKKECNGCGRIKDKQCFHVYKKASDGLKGTCRVCRKTEQNTQYYKYHDKSKAYKRNAKGLNQLKVQLLQRGLWADYKIKQENKRL